MSGVTEPLGDPLNPQFTTNLGTFQIVWTDGIVNLCFFILYALFQVNAFVMFRQLEYRSFANGVILFSLALVMELLLIIEPPQVLCWIPFWQNSVGRGLALCLISVFSLYGDYLIGFVSLIASLVVAMSPVLTGSFATSPALLNYAYIFNQPPHVSTPKRASPIRTAKGKGGDVRPVKYQSIPFDIEE